MGRCARPACCSVSCRSWWRRARRRPGPWRAHLPPPRPPPPGRPWRPNPRALDTVLAGLDRRTTAGQLVVVGAPLGAAVGPSVDLVKRLPVGGVLLTGRSRSGVAAVAARTAALQQAVTGRVGLLVAADQEGGQVQTLTGPGFSAIPTAVEQGRWSSAKLTDAAAGWGGELKAAGVNLDLAPVLDVLSVQLGPSNLAVGVTTASSAPARWGHPRRHAFLEGLCRAGVVPAVKHFPGLGRVRDNTDHTATSPTRPPTTTPMSAVPRGDPCRGAGRDDLLGDLPPHRPAPARAVLPYRRHRDAPRPLGFGGVVISDDLAGGRGLRGPRGAPGGPVRGRGRRPRAHRRPADSRPR